MSESNGDQIHAASPTRRERARREGDFAKSYELSAAVQMVGVLLVAYLLFDQVGNWLQYSTTEIWSNHQVLTSAQPSDITGMLSKLIFSSLGALVPLLVLFMLVGFASHWVQTGPVFLANKVTPDLARLAPTHWSKRLFSLGTLAFPLVGFPKTVLAAVVAAASCWINREQFFELGMYSADQMVQKMFFLVLQVCSHVAALLLLASVLDYGLKYLSFQKRIRMSDQELRDEVRSQNGDPRVAAQRQEQRRTIYRV